MHAYGGCAVGIGARGRCAPGAAAAKCPVQATGGAPTKFSSASAIAPPSAAQEARGRVRRSPALSTATLPARVAYGIQEGWVGVPNIVGGTGTIKK